LRFRREFGHALDAFAIDHKQWIEFGGIGVVPDVEGAIVENEPLADRGYGMILVRGAKMRR
jgi:hypothetical protein